MKALFYIAIAIAIIWFVVVKIQEENRPNIAFYYPYGIEHDPPVRTIEFKGVEECRSWASAQASLNGGKGDYECGFKCHLLDGTLSYVCKDITH